MFLQIALHSYMCQIYPLTHALKMMVYLLDLQLVLWFIIEPLVDYVGEMMNVMEPPSWISFWRYRYLLLVLLWYV